MPQIVGRACLLDRLDLYAAVKAGPAHQEQPVPSSHVSGKCVGPNAQDEWRMSLGYLSESQLDNGWTFRNPGTQEVIGLDVKTYVATNPYSCLRMPMRLLTCFARFSQISVISALISSHSAAVAALA